MRIVSLLPSATEIVCTLGLSDQLVGVTHECDYPPEVHGRPVLTSNALGSGEMTSAAIDAAISDLIRQGHSAGTIYHIDAVVLGAVQPDLILTQQLCEVCAVAFSEVQRAVASIGRACRVVSLEPSRIEEILATILQVGVLTGTGMRAAAVVDHLRERLVAVTTRLQGIVDRPRVWCCEWLDPPFGAGHWVPEQVALAGGEEVLGRAGQRSMRLRWEEVLAGAPEVIVLMPCGYDLQGTLRESERTAPPPGWEDLPAVRGGRVYAVDGSAYFSRPGPRVVDGAELLAHLLHPDRVPPPQPGRFLRLQPGIHRWAGPVGGHRR
jgi:iron complex transport system substrate-binding protein